jgi:TetR/AcrR family transcriptional regulator
VRQVAATSESELAATDGEDAVRTTKRQAAAAERRAQILAASRKVFLDRGLVGARTRQIAEEAGVKEAVLYSHFASKEEIFAAAVFDPLEELVTEIVDRVKVAAEIPDDHAKQRVFVEENQRAFEVMQEVVPLLGVALFSDVELGRKYFVERLAPLLQKWADATRLGMKGWEHRKVDPRTVNISAWGMYYGVILSATMRNEELDRSRTSKEMVDLLYYGLANKPGGRKKKAQ